jgi:hypothetical protein
MRRLIVSEADTDARVGTDVDTARSGRRTETDA